MLCLQCIICCVKLDINVIYDNKSEECDFGMLGLLEIENDINDDIIINEKDNKLEIDIYSELVIVE